MIMDPQPSIAGSLKRRRCATDRMFSTAALHIASGSLSFLVYGSHDRDEHVRREPGRSARRPARKSVRDAAQHALVHGARHPRRRRTMDRKHHPGSVSSGRSTICRPCAGVRCSPVDDRKGAARSFGRNDCNVRSNGRRGCTPEVLRSSASQMTAPASPAGGNVVAADNAAAEASETLRASDFVGTDPRGFPVILRSTTWRHVEPHADLQGHMDEVVETLVRPDKIIDNQRSNVGRGSFAKERTAHEKYVRYSSVLKQHVIVPAQKLDHGIVVAGSAGGAVPIVGARDARTAYTSLIEPGRAKVFWSKT